MDAVIIMIINVLVVHIVIILWFIVNDAIYIKVY